MLFNLTNPEIAILMMVIFLFAVLLGFPIAFTLMAMGLGFGYYAYFDPTRMEHLLDNRIFQLFVQNTYTVMDNTVLTAVPLFLFAVLLGFPIAFTLMAMGVGFGYYAYFDPTRMEHLLDNRIFQLFVQNTYTVCLLYTSPSPRDLSTSRMPSSA